MNKWKSCIASTFRGSYAPRPWSGEPTLQVPWLIEIGVSSSSYKQTREPPNRLDKDLDGNDDLCGAIFLSHHARSGARSSRSRWISLFLLSPHPAMVVGRSAALLYSYAFASGDVQRASPLNRTTARAPLSNHRRRTHLQFYSDDNFWNSTSILTIV